MPDKRNAAELAKHMRQSKLLQRDVQVRGQASVLLLRNVIKHTSNRQECPTWLRLQCNSAPIHRFTLWGADSNSFPASCLAQILFSFPAVELDLNPLMLYDTRERIAHYYWTTPQPTTPQFVSDQHKNMLGKKDIPGRLGNVQCLTCSSSKVILPAFTALLLFFAGSGATSST